MREGTLFRRRGKKPRNLPGIFQMIAEERTHGGRTYEFNSCDSRTGPGSRAGSAGVDRSCEFNGSAAAFFSCPRTISPGGPGRDSSDAYATSTIAAPFGGTGWISNNASGYPLTPVIAIPWAK